MPRRRTKLLWAIMAVFVVVIFVLPVLIYLVPRHVPGKSFTYEIYGASLSLLGLAHNLTKLYGEKRVHVHFMLSADEFACYILSLLRLVPRSLVTVKRLISYPIVVVYDHGNPRGVFLGLSSSREYILSLVQRVELEPGSICNLSSIEGSLMLTCTVNTSLVKSIASLLNMSSCPVLILHDTNETLGTKLVKRINREVALRLADLAGVKANTSYIICTPWSKTLILSNTSLPPLQLYKSIVMTIESNGTSILEYHNKTLERISGARIELVREVNLLCSGSKPSYH